MLGIGRRPTFWQIAKSKSTGSFSAQPYVWGLMAALLWSLYGVLRDQVPVITINAACVAFQIVYLALYLRYATAPQRVSIHNYYLIS
jgi:MtN3 and saliva related transmembrane protein